MPKAKKVSYRVLVDGGLYYDGKFVDRDGVADDLIGADIPWMVELGWVEKFQTSETDEPETETETETEEDGK